MNIRVAFALFNDFCADAQNLTDSDRSRKLTGRRMENRGGTGGWRIENRIERGTRPGTLQGSLRAPSSILDSRSSSFRDPSSSFIRPCTDGKIGGLFVCMMKRTIQFLLPLIIVCSGFAAEQNYRQEIVDWQAKRLKNLQGDEGWPTLAGLFWLKEGENKVGSNKSLPVVLPATVPKVTGVLLMSSGKVQFQPEPGVAITLDGKPVTAAIELKSDQDPNINPSTLCVGSVSFYIIKRGDKTGVRVRDKNAPARKELASLQYYPIDTAWRFEAAFEPYNPPKKIPITNVLGMVEDADFVGTLAFKRNGTEYRLDVQEEINDGKKEFFLMFGDETNKQYTYASGRFIYTASPDKNGNVILDFNKAYSPPCAFTSYATCPLPPKQNKLPIQVTAGEKRPPHPKS